MEGEFLSGRLRLHDEVDVGGIVEGAWENVYAGRRHVGSFVVFYFTTFVALCRTFPFQGVETPQLMTRGIGTSIQ